MMNRKNWPGPNHPSSPKGQGIKPIQSENISRQQVRHLLRKKAHKDVLEQYGMVGKRNNLFVGFDWSFPRRIRRRVQLAMQKRWYAQIRAAQREDQKPASFLDKVRGWFGRNDTGNTLAASGFGG